MPSAQRVSQTHLCAYLLLASAARLPLPSASISFVFALSSLFHLSYKELISALQEVHRVLHPEGEVLLHFLDIEDWRHTLAKQICPDQAPDPTYQVDTSGKRHSTFSFVRFLISDFPPAEIPHLGDDNSPI
jgi:ubiquinone/menaquinone biosynthesis C-methylase UbiE